MTTMGEQQRPLLVGAGVTFAAHLATLGVPLVLALWLAAPDNAYDEDQTWFFLYGSILAQLLLLLFTIAIGGVLISQDSRRRAGQGIFAGWALGLVTMPFLWLGLWYISIGP